MKEDDLVDMYITDVFCSQLIDEIDDLEKEDEMSLQDINTSAHIKNMIKKEKVENNSNITVYS